MPGPSDEVSHAALVMISLVSGVLSIGGSFTLYIMHERRTRKINSERDIGISARIDALRDSLSSYENLNDGRVTAIEDCHGGELERATRLARLEQEMSNVKIHQDQLVQSQSRIEQTLLDVLKKKLEDK